MNRVKPAGTALVAAALLVSVGGVADAASYRPLARGIRTATAADVTYRYVGSHRGLVG